MKIATWNVNGIRARQQQVLEWIAREHPEIVCIQELKAPREKVPESLARIENYWSCWHGVSAYSGVGLLVRRDLCSLEPPFTHPGFDFETRIVAVQLDNMLIASVYVPNGGKDYSAKLNFLKEMHQFALECREMGLELILCGDMNVTRTDLDVHPKERKTDAIGQRPDERKLFENIFSEAGMVDVGRSLDPANDRLFTWWPPWRQMRQKNIGWRLDYVVAGRSLAARMPECTVLSDFGSSDHAPIVAEFR